jgi:predicted nucleic acid-binding protein
MASDLTVDVGVLMAASGLTSALYQQSSLNLAIRIESTADWGIAMDRKGLIRHQYSEKLRQDTFGHFWLIRLASLNKIAMIDSRIDRGTRVRLDESHFDMEDRKYVATAAQTECRILISHDDDYSPGVRAVLKKIGVSVLSAQQAVAL